MKKNVAGQVIGAQMIDSTNGADFTGTVTVYVTGDAGTQTIGSVGSGVCTHEGRGLHTYLPAQAETNFDHVAFTFAGTNAITATVQVYPTFPQTGDNFARLGAPAGASVSADVAAVKVDTAAVLVDTGTTLDAKLDTIDDFLDTEIAAILAAVDTEIAAILVDTDTTIPALIAALNNLSAAQVNTEVLDVMATDTHTQPGQEAPAATTSYSLMLRYLYKTLRNKKTQTATARSLFADDGTTVDQKATDSDDATTFTKGELGTGP